MANTLGPVRVHGDYHVYMFNCSSAAGATETFAMPAGARIRGITPAVFTSATARTATGYAYVQSTGVLTVSGLTAADSFELMVFTD